ncbi:cation:proton antiporter [Amycolatopsis balhimycina DSM 5908]|uniref:Cation:proton antiporter n=1 Tax=Amycolatopsis balhimycina DSM 5908 TaxID=1081091 RepID=A0A428WS01_AMYBA|nr:cation:proton antiporter [Amycolatopsis balhimycina]RSM45813.1 cation:proton antiporter [Amycolatopsis balhimycina DSM 5908]
MPELAVLLAALAVLLGLARLAGAAAARLGQPAVLGEILCGVAVAPATRRLPAPVDTTLTAIAQLGLVLFLFAAGAHLAPSLTRTRLKAVVVPALGATLVPLGLGAVLALGLARRHAPAGTGPFVVFVAAAMAVTALPVLARILAERGLLGSAAGRRALTAAAVSDLTAWALLAVAAAASHGWSAAAPLPVVVLLAAVPWLARSRFRRRLARLSRPSATAVLVALACAAAAVTEAAGLHPAIGAFFAGVVLGHAVPAPGPAALVTPVASLLAPLYFVLVGRAVDLGRLDAALAADIAAVAAVAVAGKCGGAYLGARLGGLAPHPAGVFAVLMNTRGVTELVFAGIGLGLGVIDGPLYTAMVVMALATTAMTGPLLTRLSRQREGV